MALSFLVLATTEASPLLGTCKKRKIGQKRQRQIRNQGTQILRKWGTGIFSKFRGQKRRCLTGSVVVRCDFFRLFPVFRALFIQFFAPVFRALFIQFSCIIIERIIYPVFAHYYRAHPGPCFSLAWKAHFSAKGTSYSFY